MSWKRFITVRYLKWVLWILIALQWGLILVEASGGTTFNWRLAVRETGDLAWALLIVTIFLGLLQKLFFRSWLLNNLLPIRKYTGILAFLIAGSHGVFQMLRMGAIDNVAASVRAMFSLQHAMVFGTVSFLVMLPLFLTSTTWCVRKMGYKAWKRLQRLAHVAFIAAGLHIALIGYVGGRGVEWNPLVLLGVYGVGYAVFSARKFVASRKTI